MCLSVLLMSVLLRNYDLSKSWEQDNCPPEIAIPEIVPQIISPWTIGAQSIAKQNN